VAADHGRIVDGRMPIMSRLAPLLLLAAAAGCGAPLTCEPVAATVSGEMGRDLLGAWRSVDAHTRDDVWRFDADGTYDLIEPPTASDSGAIRSGRYAVAGDLLTVTGATTSRTTPIAITETLLVGLGPDHRRVVCSGYGF
jgi:hypothetical protein